MKKLCFVFNSGEEGKKAPATDLNLIEIRKQISKTCDHANAYKQLSLMPGFLIPLTSGPLQAASVLIFGILACEAVIQSRMSAALKREHGQRFGTNPPTLP